MSAAVGVISEGIVSDKVIQLWNLWETRGLVLSSLFLQILLIAFGSRRKYISNVWIRVLVWSAYLSADMIATFALGNISSSQGEGDSPATNTFIQTFWAPFLLLHLGGPDTITSYSIEDNELWLRHLLDLGTQSVMALYIFVRIWGRTTLEFPAIPIFITAIVKYGERVWVQRYSSAENIKDSLLSASPAKDGSSGREKITPRQSPPPPTMKNSVHQAYYLFNMSMYLFQNIPLGITELKDSYSVVSSLSPARAFQVVEIELGFMFDVLYTKAPLVYSRVGIILRSISFSCSVIGLLLYSVFVNKRNYKAADIDVTYILVVGFLVTEVYSLIYLFSSDWTMVWWTKPDNVPSESCWKTLINGRRWSSSVGQYNLISSCCKTKSTSRSIVKYANLMGVSELLGIEEMMKHFQITWKDVDDEMKEFISKELFMKGQTIMSNLEDHTSVAKKFMTQRGDGVLQKITSDYDFEHTTIEAEFYHSILIWHIATDLCYHHDVDNNYPFSETSKRLSDYLLYLLVMKPSMVPEGIGGMKSRMADTCDEVSKFLKEGNKTWSNEKEVCIELLQWDTGAITGEERRKSVLIVGTELAKELLTYCQGDNARDKWVLIAKVWVEMVSFAACHCSWKEHVLQLRRGGELVSHVCLLMAHLGLSQQYRVANVKASSADDSLEKKWDELSEEMKTMTNIMIGREGTSNMPWQRIALLREIQILLENDSQFRGRRVSESD